MISMKKKTRMSAAVLCALALLLALTLNGCAKTGSAHKQSIVLQSADKKDSLKVSENWSMAENSLYPTAELIAKGPDTDYVAVVKKSKSELPGVNTPEDFFTYVKGRFALLATGASWGDRSEVKIGGLSGLAVTMQGTGKSSGKKLSYWVDMLEGTNDYYEIIGWSDASHASADSGDIQSIMGSFQNT